ncbi:surface lipoprotein assembly modifier [Roseivivax sp. CAU 1761]
MSFRKTIAVAALAAAALVSEAGAQPQQAASISTGTAFQAALISLNSGRPEPAIRIFRKILAANPGLVRVRLELARALYAADQYSQAKEQFRIVLSSGDLPPNVRANVIRFIRRIDEDRGLRTDFSIGLRAPSGSGRSYESDEIEVIMNGRPLTFQMDREDPPATGVDLQGSIRKQWPLRTYENGSKLTGYLRGKGAVYETRDTEWDTANAEVGAGLQLTWPKSTGFVEATYGRGFEAWELTETRVGVGSGIQVRRDSGLTTAVSLSFQDVTLAKYSDAKAARTNVSFEVIRPLAGRDQLTLGVSYQRQNADRGDLAYDFAEIRASRKTETAGGFVLEPSLYAQIFRQEDPTPGLPRSRSEEEYGVDLRVEKPDVFVFGRLTPYVEVGASKRNSNFDAYSYRDVRINAGFSSAF